MGSPFTPGIDYRGSNLTIEYELVCLVNYFFIIIIVIQYCFWKQKRNSGKRSRKVRGVGYFREEGARFRDQAPPPPPFRPCDTGRNSTFLIRKEMVRNVKKQTKINIIVSLQLKIKFHLR